MELWIRSQDKTILTKINEDIYVYDNLDKTSTIKTDKWQLGTYTTKERALEVLDEIQDILKPIIKLTKLGKVIGKTFEGTVYSEPNEYEFEELSTYVYEMPKE